MDIHTKLLTALFACGSLTLSLTACGNSSGDQPGSMVSVDKSVVDSLNKKISVFSELTNEDKETLLRLMKSLDEIADSAFAIGRERQLGGSVRDMSMVDKIKFRLATVQAELDDARKKAETTPLLRENIDELQAQITAQQTYIESLRSSIRVKKSDLRQRYIQLKTAHEQLLITKRAYENTATMLSAELQRLQNTRSSAWTDAADKLVASANEVQLVRKHGPMANRTREAKRRILQRAIDCYHKATSMGDASAAQKASRAESILQGLNAE